MRRLNLIWWRVLVSFSAVEHKTIIHHGCMHSRDWMDSVALPNRSSGNVYTVLMDCLFVCIYRTITYHYSNNVAEELMEWIEAAGTHGRLNNSFR